MGQHCWHNINIEWYEVCKRWVIGLGPGNKMCQSILTSPKAERETRFQLILPVGNHNVTKNLTGHRILWPKFTFQICTKLLSTRFSSSPSTTVTTSTSFELPSSHARVTSIKFTKQEWVSQWVSESVTDKHSQWSDSGPIKMINIKFCYSCHTMEEISKIGSNKNTLEEIHTYAELQNDPKASLPDLFTTCFNSITNVLKRLYNRISLLCNPRCCTFPFKYKSLLFSLSNIYLRLSLTFRLEYSTTLYSFTLSLQTHTCFDSFRRFDILDFVPHDIDTPFLTCIVQCHLHIIV